MKTDVLAVGMVFAVLAPWVGAQEPAPKPLSNAHFKERREAVRQAVREIDETLARRDGGREVRKSLVLLRGANNPPSNGSFSQDQDFWYLTGQSEPELVLILEPWAEGEEQADETLYVPPFNRFTATWDGSRLVPGEKAEERTGLTRVGNVRSLWSRELEQRLAPVDGERPVLWTMLSPPVNKTATTSTAGSAARAIAKDPFDGRPHRNEQFKNRLETRFPGLEVRDLTPILQNLRGVKTEEEIAQVRAATMAAVHGIAEAMKSVEPGMYEYQLAAAARYVFSRLGAGPDAYAAIVGGGPNGCVLHYDANTRKLRDDDLIVMDYGPTVHGYATDVTRTFPASGKFTDAQRKLVQDVHDVQQALIAMVKPGASLGEISGRCRNLLREKGYRSFHGPCHHVGLAVHDMGGSTLKPGMLITVEPGAYLVDERMGCRIEDVVLVTEDGCEVLSKDLPSTPDEIEELMKASGVAQRPIGL